MSDWITRIDALDETVFDEVPSQTTVGDRRSLLAVQRATAKKHGRYGYLETGSFLGGSIQTHLVDDRCERIFSIDPRPSQQPDDRSPGCVVEYENNTRERMLQLLAGIGDGDLGKIECFDCDASEVDTDRISRTPEIVFIDGEHTNAAVLSDFRFCRKIMSPKGTILFHDCGIVWEAIVEICCNLKREKCEHVALDLEGVVYGIFFDRKLVHEDPHLAFFYRKQKRRELRERLKRALPPPLVKLVKRVRSWLRESAEGHAAADG